MTCFRKPELQKPVASLLRQMLLWGFMCTFSTGPFSQTIKTITVYHTGKGQKILKLRQDFNAHGHLTSETECLNADCSLFDGERRYYNAAGQLTEDSVYTNQWGYHQLVWHKVYTWYPDGKMETEKKLAPYCPEGYDEMKTWMYDSQGRVAEEWNRHYCHQQVSRNNREIYEYDSTGTLTEKRMIKEKSGDTIAMNRYAYDAHGNLVTDSLLVPENDSLQFLCVKEHQYDKKQRLISKVSDFGTSIHDSTSIIYRRGAKRKEKLYDYGRADNKYDLEIRFFSRKGLWVRSKVYVHPADASLFLRYRRKVEYEYFE